MNASDRGRQARFERVRGGGEYLAGNWPTSFRPRQRAKPLQRARVAGGGAGEGGVEEGVGDRLLDSAAAMRVEGGIIAGGFAEGEDPPGFGAVNCAQAPDPGADI